MAENQEKTKANIIALLIGSANLKSLLTFIGSLITAIYFAVTFYIRISAMEAEFPIVRAKQYATEKKCDSLQSILTMLKEHTQKIEDRIDVDDKYIDHLFDYKQPYGKWGNQ